MKKKIWVAVEILVDCKKEFLEENIKEHLPYVNVGGAGVDCGFFLLKTTGKHVILNGKPK